DLQGPRIRVGELPEQRTLVIGEQLRLVHEDRAEADDIPVTYESLADDVSTGDRILINDGLLELVVMDVSDGRVSARVLHGGELRRNKGLNLSGVDGSASSLTEKERSDIAFPVYHELYYLMLSFLRRATDIKKPREMILRHMLVVVTIEKGSAPENTE